MLFRKTSKTDPEKSDGTISVFTTNNTVINYNSRLNSVKLIEDKLTVTYKTIDNVNYIEVSKFRSSSNKINKPYAQLIEILTTLNIYYASIALLIVSLLSEV